MKWARDTGGAPVRAAVARAFHEAIAASRALPLPRDPEPGVAAAWRAHGRLGRVETRAAVESGLREIVEPCARALLGQGPPMELRT